MLHLTSPKISKNPLIVVITYFTSKSLSDLKFNCKMIYTIVICYIRSTIITKYTSFMNFLIWFLRCFLSLNLNHNSRIALRFSILLYHSLVVQLKDGFWSCVSCICVPTSEELLKLHWSHSNILCFYSHMFMKHGHSYGSKMAFSHLKSCSFVFVCHFLSFWIKYLISLILLSSCCILFSNNLNFA